MFKPDDFLSNFNKHKDFAKVSKFHVEILKPPGFVATDVNFAELRFQCEAAELPGYNINTVDARIYGVPAPAAASASFNDVTLTFICAGDLWEKKLFDYWLNLVVPVNNYHVRFKSEYASKINITQFYEAARDNAATTPEASYIVTLWNAFPITLSPLSLNWGDDGIHKLSVTFKYDYWSTSTTQKFGLGQTAASAPVKPAQPQQPTNPVGSGNSNFKPGVGTEGTGIRPTPGTSTPIAGGGKFAGGGASGVW